MRYVNKVGRSFLGIGASSALATDPAIYVSDPYKQSVSGEISQLARTKGFWSGPIDVIHQKTAGLIACEAIVYSAATAGDDSDGLVFALWDAEKVSAPSALSTLSSEELALADKMRVQVRTAVHEINNSTSSILLNLAIVADKVTDAGILDRLEMCQKAADRTTDTLNSLLRGLQAFPSQKGSS